jgi:hypothetical protein
MSILGIDYGEHIPEFLVSFCLSDYLERLSVLPVWGSIRISHRVEETIDIESSTTAEDRDFSF